MMVNGRVMALLVDLEREVNRIIEEHWAADEASPEPTLKYSGPFTVSIAGADGVIARFMEDGIDLYPVNR